MLLAAALYEVHISMHNFLLCLCVRARLHPSAQYGSMEPSLCLCLVSGIVFTSFPCLGGGLFILAGLLFFANPTIGQDLTSPDLWELLQFPRRPRGERCGNCRGSQRPRQGLVGTPTVLAMVRLLCKGVGTNRLTLPPFPTPRRGWGEWQCKSVCYRVTLKV